MKKIKIERLDVVEFKNFINKILSVQKFLSFKINKDEIKASVASTDNTIAKALKVDTKNILSSFDFDDEIKISVFNGKKIVDALSKFNKDYETYPVSYIIFYEMNRDGDYLAKDIHFKQEGLTIKIACADDSLSFFELNDEQISKTFNESEASFKFEFDIDNFSKLRGLLSLDKEDQYIYIKLSKDEDNRKPGIYFTGEMFDFLITENYEFFDESASEILVENNNLSVLDNETCDVFVFGNKILFKSKASNTTTAIATANKV